MMGYVIFLLKQQVTIISMVVIVASMIFIYYTNINKNFRKKYGKEIERIISIVGSTLGIVGMFFSIAITYPQFDNSNEQTETVSNNFIAPENPEFIKIEGEEYNYQIEYPSYFKTEHSEEGDKSDLQYTSPDRKTSLVIIARKYDSELPIDFTLDKIISENNGIVTYKDNEMRNEGWYVVSIKTDKYYLYVKCMSDGKNIRLFKFSYPLDQKELYFDKFDYTKYISKSFIKLK